MIKHTTKPYDKTECKSKMKQTWINPKKKLIWNALEIDGFSSFFFFSFSDNSFIEKNNEYKWVWQSNIKFILLTNLKRILFFCTQ